jgi:4-hydroxy-2-oxoheptanedioate aldolase
VTVLISNLTRNKSKAKLKAGETVLGCFMRHPDPGLAEVVGYLGWDYLIFDGEHSPLSPRECEHLARVCELTGVTPIVRVPSNLPWMIAQVLDAGMQGVQIPMINSGADALTASRAAKYHPLGTRGLATTRAAHFGQLQPFSIADHVTRSNAETLVIAQVETPAGIEALPAILQAPELDVVFIGPNDLSLSLGVPGEMQHPKVQDAFDTIISAVTKTDKALGILVPNVEAALEWQRKGACYIMVVMEAILAPAVRGFLKTARQT